VYVCEGPPGPPGPPGVPGRKRRRGRRGGSRVIPVSRSISLSTFCCMVLFSFIRFLFCSLRRIRRLIQTTSTLAVIILSATVAFILFQFITTVYYCWQIKYLIWSEKLFTTLRDSCRFMIRCVSAWPSAAINAGVRLVLQTYSTVEICWTFHQSSSQLSIVGLLLVLKFKRGVMLLKRRPFLG